MKKFNYVSGFITPVPKKNLARYRKVAKIFGKAWLKHGALSVVETVEDDVPKGSVTSFPKSVKLKSGEVVVLSWVTFKNKASRNKAFGKVMSDPTLAKYMNEDDLPFDGMRMFWGGFKPIVNL